MTAPIPALIFHRFCSRLLLFLLTLFSTASARQSLPHPSSSLPLATPGCCCSRHSNPIFYTVKPVCLSSRPRLISSFQNRNVMARRKGCWVIDCSPRRLTDCHTGVTNDSHLSAVCLQFCKSVLIIIARQGALLTSTYKMCILSFPLTFSFMFLTG